jgi:hypothetical protein
MEGAGSRLPQPVSAWPWHSADCRLQELKSEEVKELGLH